MTAPRSPVTDSSQHRRARLGQFFTPRALVDRVCAWAIRSRQERVIDPTCGAGDFLAGAVNRLSELGARRPRVWGVDVDAAVLAVARERLGREAVLREEDFLRCLPEDGLGVFDAVVGNFPYVRQEALGPETKESLRRVVERLAPDEVEGLTGQADLYVYLFLQVERFLRPGGRLGVVVSNAWLDVDYGHALRRFFLRRFREVTIVESRREAWFDEPTINPVVVLLEKGPGPARTRFVQVELPLAQIPHEGFIGEGCPCREPIVSESDRWGIALRAPQAYLDLSAELRGKTVPLRGVLADVERGVTPGVVDFFYVTKETADRHGIEPCFLRPVVRSLRETEGVRVREEALSRRLFACRWTPERLLREGLGALRHILWGMQQETRAQARGKLGGQPFPLVSTLTARPLWYDVGDVAPADFLLNRFVGDRYLVPAPPPRAVAGDVFFAGRWRQGVDRELALALLNSSIVFLMMEVLGRKTWRQGVLYFYGSEVSALSLPDPARLTADDRARILAAFQPVASRPVGAYAGESVLPDRRVFEEAVLRTLGLDAQWRTRISEALAQEIHLRTRVLPGKEPWRPQLHH